MNNRIRVRERYKCAIQLVFIQRKREEGRPKSTISWRMKSEYVGQYSVPFMFSPSCDLPALDGAWVRSIGCE